MVFRTKSSTALIRSSVFSMRSAALGADVHLERSRVDLGKEIAAHDRPHDDERCRQQAEGHADRQERVPEHAVQSLDVILDAGLDHLLPAGESSLNRPLLARGVARAAVAVPIDLEGLRLRRSASYAVRVHARRGIRCRDRPAE